MWGGTIKFGKYWFFPIVVLLSARCLNLRGICVRTACECLHYHVALGWWRGWEKAVRNVWLLCVCVLPCMVDLRRWRGQWIFFSLSGSQKGCSIERSDKEIVMPPTWFSDAIKCSHLVCHSNGRATVLRPPLLLHLYSSYVYVRVIRTCYTLIVWHGLFQQIDKNISSWWCEKKTPAADFRHSTTDWHRYRRLVPQERNYEPIWKNKNNNK